jgi:hypothetical protein
MTEHRRKESWPELLPNPGMGLAATPPTDHTLNPGLKCPGHVVRTKISPRRRLIPQTPILYIINEEPSKKRELTRAAT